MTHTPKLRDSARRQSREPFLINEIPEEVLFKIAEHFIYLLSMGRKDLTGSDWGDALAFAVGGDHLDSPLGIADVTLDGTAWSCKTVKVADPFCVKTTRLISGRCSPDYSYGIANPHEDIERTGRAVLEIWNERVNIARDYFNPVRTIVMVRSNDLSKYVVFEEETVRYNVSDYEWSSNKNGNLIGVDRTTGEQRFTWQPHGSQFTIHASVPPSAARFSIRLPEVISKESILSGVGYDPSWVTIYPRE